MASDAQQYELQIQGEILAGGHPLPLTDRQPDPIVSGTSGGNQSLFAEEEKIAISALAAVEGVSPSLFRALAK
jgi:hypothetical protein